MIIKSILLVEDHPSMNFLNKMELLNSQKAGDIEIVLNGEEAITYLTNLKSTNAPFPSLIFLDINMPRMNGWEFLEEYKLFDQSIRKDTKIIILTSSTNPEDEVRAERIPLVNLYKLKPINEALINEVIERFFMDA